MEPLLDLGLGLVGEFETTGGEKLDAIVGERVVRRRDHRPGQVTLGAHPGDGRCRHHAEKFDRCAARGQPGGERSFEHRARSSGVSADDEGVAPQNASGGTAKGQCHLWSQIGICSSPHTIGPEGRQDNRRSHVGLSAWSTAEPYGPS